MGEHERCQTEAPCAGDACTRDRCRMLVRRARTIATPEARAVLEAFCEASWPKVYALVRRQGYRGADAEDLTQSYFARFLERGDLEYAATWQGRLEGFLRISVRHFLSNARDRERAKKRGGGQRTISLDAPPAPAPRHPKPSTPSRRSCCSRRRGRTGRSRTRSAGCASRCSGRAARRGSRAWSSTC